MIRFSTVSRIAILIGLMFSAQLAKSQEHRVIRGSMQPGMIAFRKLISEPGLQGYVQPVRVVVSGDSSTQIWNQGGFGQIESSELLVGLEIGPVYRLKVTSNLRGSTKELYPTIEVVDRLYPPEGLKLSHPIKIVINRSDIEKALEGRLVTKVIYLEDPESALPFREADDDQSYFDIARGENPFTVADRLGRPMAIVRMGSRMPSVNEADSGFESGGAPVQFYDAQTILDQTNNVDANLQFYRQAACAPANQPTTVCPPVDGSSNCPPVVCPPVVCPPVCVPCSPERRRDEYVCDGDDKNDNVRVDRSSNVQGLDIEDTIGHFETYDGRTIVASSNRVCIYAPGFAAVRQVLETIHTDYTQRLESLDRQTPLQLSRGKDISTVTKQNLQLKSDKGALRASGFRDLTRGVSVDNTIQLTGTRSRFKAFEDLQFVRYGKFSSSESARLGLAIQSAVAWDDNVSAQITVKGAQPIVVDDVSRVQEAVGIDAKSSHPTLRLCKLASKISAKPGDIVDFTIRFDNFGRSRIANVTIIDNLSPRLEYVDGSAECSSDASFKTESNDAGSLTLNWTITDPLDVGKGGLIRFQCRVR